MAQHAARAEDVQSKQGHRCVVALTADQAEDVQSGRTLRMAWFGDGWSVPVKGNREDAVISFFKAKQIFPNKMIEFYVPFHLYHEWVDKGLMKFCPYGDGYRICFDIYLTDVDPDFTLLTID